MLWNEIKSEKSMVEGSYVLNKRERVANAALRQQETNDVVLGLVILKGMLLNSIEQLSIMEIRNNRLACRTRIEKNGALTGLVIEGTAPDACFIENRNLKDALE